MAAGLPAARILDTQIVPQKRDSEKRQTNTLKTLQNGIPQQPNLAYEFLSGLSQQQDLPNGIEKNTK